MNMELPDIFTQEVANGVIDRIEKINENTVPGWGKMNAGQVMAHLNVPYEMVFENKHPKTGAFMRFLLKLIAKDAVVSARPYKKNTRTAPAFIIKGNRNFELEKSRLIEYIDRVQKLGAKNFDQKESNSFGKLSMNQWNNMFYKHLDHHLTQFGV